MRPPRCSIAPGTLRRSAGSGTVNNSDSLAIRFYGSSAFDASGAKVADNTVFTCTGAAVPASTTMGELGLSVFSVRLYQGEPELYCSSNPGSGTRTSAQIARGVESFQVMYGVDLCTGTPCTRDGVPDRWVSAADVASADWRHVRAVRLMVMPTCSLVEMLMLASLCLRLNSNRYCHIHCGKV